MNKCTYCEANTLVTYCQACGTFAPETQLAALAAERDALQATLRQVQHEGDKLWTKNQALQAFVSGDITRQELEEALR